MKILTYCAAALFAGTSLSTLQAQNAGDDVTTDYLVNADFELGNAAEAYTDIGTQHSQGGQRHQPTGWVFQSEWLGWNDAQVYAATPTEPNSTYLTTANGSYAFNAWSGGFTYANLYQEANLPSGFYKLTAAVRMTDNNQAYLTTQNLYVKDGTDSLNTAFPSTCVGRTTTGTIDGFWQDISVEFSLGAPSTIRFGVSGSGDGTNAAGWFQCDNFRLVFLGSANDPTLYAKDRLAKYANEIEVKYSSYDGFAKAYEAKVRELLTQAETLNNTEGATAEDFNACYNALKAVLAEMESSKTSMTQLDALISAAQTLISDATYLASVPALQTAQNAALDVWDSDQSFKADIDQAIIDLTAAIRTYKLSAPASLKDPADFTFLISCPTFTKDGGTVSNASDGAKGSWVNGNKITSSSALDARLNTVNGYNCWNSWASAWKGTMDLHQDLAGLPVGLYTLSAMHTADAAASTTAHLYATTLAGTAVSPICNDFYSGTGTFANDAQWVTYQTDTILVASDGALRIGITSTGEGTGAGWFCVTNFDLKYYGVTSALDAYKKSLASRITLAKELAAKGMLPSETTTITAAITTAEAADVSSTSTIEAAMITLNAAIAEADTAALAMTNFKAGSYATLAAQATNDGASQGLPDFINNHQLKAADEALLAADATPAVYTSLEKILAIAVSYGKAQIATTAAINEASADNNLQMLLSDAQEHYDGLSLTADTTALKTYTTELGAYVTFGNLYTLDIALGQDATYASTDRDIFNNTMATILASVKSASDLTAASNKIYDAASILKGNVQPGDDVTTKWIVNPENTSTGNSDAMTGWSITKTNGNTFSATGQHWSGDGTRRYLDSWNATTGKLQYVAQQSIKGLPNGTYKLKCAARTSGTGSFLYAMSGDDTLKVEIPNNGSVGGSIWTDTEDATMKAVNSSTGYGWAWIEIGTINVGAKELVFGVTSKNAFTHSTWAGTWFSASDFKLIYVSADYTPTGGVSIDEISADGASSLTAYAENGYIVVPGVTSFEVTTIAGAAVDAKKQLAPGIYVVKAAGKVAKVAVK